MRLLIRAFVFTCAFIGAAWFGDWIYAAVQLGGFHTLDSSFYIIIGTALVAGIAAAFALGDRNS